MYDNWSSARGRDSGDTDERPFTCVAEVFVVVE